MGFWQGWYMIRPPPRLLLPTLLACRRGQPSKVLFVHAKYSAATESVSPTEGGAHFFVLETILLHQVCKMTRVSC